MNWDGRIKADARFLPIASDSVQCIITSPPYWGLRDYGNPDQIGLEATPHEYVNVICEVAVELWRVLKPDGTLFLNLGDCYVSSPRGNKPGDFSTSSLTNPQRQDAVSRPRVRSYGNGGRGRQDSTVPGSFYSDLCDECRAALSNRNGSKIQQPDTSALLHAQTGHDSGRLDSSLASPLVSPAFAQESTTAESLQPLLVECSHCGNCGACLSVLRSSSRDARLCARNSAYISGTEKRLGASTDHRSDTVSSGLACQYSTTAFLKPKDLVGIPWRVAFALQEDGWYLRRDIIWSKPNPMPESITDRPTSAHEYIFLLTKSARYYYDNEAIKEPSTYAGPNGAGTQKSPYAQGFGRRTPEQERERQDKQLGHSRRHAGFNDRWGLMTKEEQAATGRNKRSVWTIATRPYSEAHYATFPEEIPEICIKAGTKPGDIVLDCFGGSGTVAKVAERLGRRWVICDLGYQALQAKRISNVQKELIL